MLEKHEEDMEEFWFNVHAKNEDVDMHEWLCINKIKGKMDYRIDILNKCLIKMNRNLL